MSSNQIGVPGEPDEGEGFPDQPGVFKPSKSRPVPPAYKAKYYNDPKYAGISNSTVDVSSCQRYDVGEQPSWVSK